MHVLCVRMYLLSTQVLNKYICHPIASMFLSSISPYTTMMLICFNFKIMLYIPEEALCDVIHIGPMHIGQVDQNKLQHGWQGGTDLKHRPIT